jgi:aryl-alcohol dehydrogenase-like predicted oxidoreductase
MSVRLILGTMTIGPAVGNAHIDGSKNGLPAWCQTPPDVAAQQLQALVNCPAALVQSGPEAGKYMIDTASAYQNGCTEMVLGQILAADPALRSKLSIHTKANTMQLPHKSLSKASVLAQCHASLASLQIDCIDIFYLHMPDIECEFVALSQVCMFMVI